ncbi:TauD/TfdA family dioxygenase [Mucilaginibacter phyllosphaerae]|uniref:Alpha-ketoglutarate-dependent taurine dioxygenase n=1 Tax=Mucilaginibacter phyllosphaerae TaxID=1812349 RepID=A0A4Y8AH63_9SPHI|nr:TauD/TfdA family dioxygenase [Mucilaginibacter phyllosphaerae]MBB3968722.1 alpha-ketoglutarate-dependent taurine dioxygenase [Mucilaginibacter phyllosphaerae]TEW67642.1 TauD/TfdA family dioxygenase [Mucilaginibacter phyllosphaerae]GGH14287.1 hypothetical protein GCM10007352_22280 [Mucilaginibacter phyllosphaerae]
MRELINLKRKPVLIESADLVKIATLQGRSLPMVISPNLPGVNLKEWLNTQRSFINQKLLENGGLLFRGFSLPGQVEFHDMLSALDIPLMKYVEGATPRTALTDKVYTATEFPSEYTIQLHNELSYVLSWPMKICFFCETPPVEGGETTIADMRKVYQRIPKEIRDEFEKRKWKLIRNYDPNFSLTWQKSFGLNTRAEVEAYCKKADLEFTWKNDAVLKTSCVRDAVHTHPVTGEKIWFNHVVFWHPSTLDARIKENFLKNFEIDDLPYNTTYGDGGKIDDEVIRIIKDAIDTETIAGPWQQGDLLLLDNMLTAHGRNAFEGQRKILVAMGQAFK